MPTQGVVDRHRVGKALIASARTHAQQVGERLQTNLAAVLEDGETLPDLTHLQLLFARLLDETFNGVARGVADILRGCCRLGDCPDLAERIRLTPPSRRRAA